MDEVKYKVSASCSIFFLIFIFLLAVAIQNFVGFRDLEIQYGDIRFLSFHVCHYEECCLRCPLVLDFLFNLGWIGFIIGGPN